MRNSVLLIGVLVILLAATAALVYYGLFELHGAPLGVHGWTAMVLGIICTLAVGIGLMTLVFYSSRRGYDEPPRLDEKRQR